MFQKLFGVSFLVLCVTSNALSSQCQNYLKRNFARASARSPVDFDVSGNLQAKDSSRIKNWSSTDGTQVAEFQDFGRTSKWTSAPTDQNGRILTYTASFNRIAYLSSPPTRLTISGSGENCQVVREIEDKRLIYDKNLCIKLLPLSKNLNQEDLNKCERIVGRAFDEVKTFLASEGKGLTVGEFNGTVDFNKTGFWYKLGGISGLIERCIQNPPLTSTTNKVIDQTTATQSTQ